MKLHVESVRKLTTVILAVYKRWVWTLVEDNFGDNS